MKKVLILITKGEIGGAQVSVYNLAKELRQTGHDVAVGFGSGLFLKEKLTQFQIPYFIFPELSRSLNPLKAFLFIYKFSINF